MKFRTTLVLIWLGVTVTLAGCSPQTEHEKEMRRINKELARAQKDLKRMQKRHPETIKPDGFYEKQGIETAMKRLDWRSAKGRYIALLERGLAPDDYRNTLEQQMLEKVAPLPSSQLKNNYLGYDFLAAIHPDHLVYKDKAAFYKTKLTAKHKTLIAKLNAKTDKIEGITWYHHPHDLANLKEASVSLYIGSKRQGEPWLRLKAEFTSRYGWLFAENVTAWHDGIKEPLVSGRFDRKNTSRVWEWLDVAPTDYQLEVLRSLSQADEAILRFNGSQRHVDVTLTTKDKRALKDVLASFEALSELAEIQ